MKDHSHSDQLEERLIEFAVRIIRFSTDLPKTATNRHISMQILRCGTAGAANYAEARGAESHADFIHKLGIVRKELNETAVWLKIAAQDVAGKPENIVAIIQENLELARIISASIRTAKASQNDHRPPTTDHRPLTTFPPELGKVVGGAVVSGRWSFAPATDVGVSGAQEREPTDV